MKGPEKKMRGWEKYRRGTLRKGHSGQERDCAKIKSDKRKKECHGGDIKKAEEPASHR